MLLVGLFGGVFNLLVFVGCCLVCFCLFFVVVVFGGREGDELGMVVLFSK